MFLATGHQDKHLFDNAVLTYVYTGRLYGGFPERRPVRPLGMGAPGARSPVRATSTWRGPGLGWPRGDGLFLVAEIH